FAPQLTVKRRDGDPSRFIIEVSGLTWFRLRALEKSGMTPDRWRSVLVVRVLREGASAEEMPPLAGTYRVDGDSLRFESRFPVEPGVRYEAEFSEHVLHHLAASLRDTGPGVTGEPGYKSKMTVEFGDPRPPVKPTVTVIAVYPSASALPENLLRFYIHFSA